MQKRDTEKEFEKLIRENESLLYKVCRMYAYTAEDRQDLSQEIIIQLWKSYPRFKGNSKLSTWLYRVAINTAITGLRKKKDFITSVEPSDLPLHIIDESSNHEEDDQLQRLHEAIGQLNPIEKAIVMLYLEDRSYEEMEDVLGMSQGNLRVRMTRIKDKLRELNKKQWKI